MNDSAEPKPRRVLNRRTFIAAAGLGLAAKTLGGFFPQPSTLSKPSEPTPSPLPVLPTTLKPTEALPTTTITGLHPDNSNQRNSISTDREKTSGLEDLQIDSVKVYGIKESLTTLDQINKLNRQFNDEFLKRLHEKCQQKNIRVPIDKQEQRGIVLDRDIRGLEAYVTNSVWKRFENEAKNDKGINLAAWLNKHIDFINNNIQEGPIPVKLRAKLERVIIIDDIFDKRKPSHTNLVVDYPLDIDARWEMCWDYRGEVNPTNGKLDKSDYLIRKNGITIDTGLTHELLHGLFNYPDEYIQDFHGDINIPSFIVNHANANADWTPWISYCLKRVEENSLRGYYTDPRGLGMAGFRKKGTAMKVWAEHPEQSSFLFLDANGDPLRGKVSVKKVKTQGNYYGKKTFESCQESDLDNGYLITNNDWFSPQVSGETIVFPTNWFLSIKTTTDQVYSLHFPTAAFNMSKIAEKDTTCYVVSFRKPDEKNVSKQTLNMVEEKSYPQFLEKSKPYATMKVEGTPVNFIWTTL